MTETQHFIKIIHRKRTQTVKFLDFSDKSSYFEVIDQPKSFDIVIDDIISTGSVDALVKYINNELIFDVISETNAIDLSYLSKLYNFYNLIVITNEFMLSQIPINKVYEAFESRKDVSGYIASFSFYISHNFKTFVNDPSIYSLPFNTIEDMLDQNLPHLTVDDIVTFSTNTYYKQGRVALTLLSKVNSLNLKLCTPIINETEKSTKSVHKEEDHETDDQKLIIEKYCSTNCLVRLFSAICVEQPFPYIQYICSIIRQRVTKQIHNNSSIIAQKKTEVSNDIASIYIALLNLTQRNKTYALKLLATMYENDKLNNIDERLQEQMTNIYLELSKLPPPSNKNAEKSNSTDDRLSPTSSFDWGAHALYMLYQLFSAMKPDPQNTNLAKGIQFLQESCLRGYKSACNAIVPFLAEGRFITMNSIQVINTLQIAADDGNVQAQYIYGYNISGPQPKFTNILKAIHYLRLAHLNGHPKALDVYLRISCIRNSDTLTTCKHLYEKALKPNTPMVEKLQLLKIAVDSLYDPAALEYANTAASLAPITGMASEFDILARQYYEASINKAIYGSFNAFAKYILRQAASDNSLAYAAEVLEKSLNSGQIDAFYLYARLFMKGWRNHPKDLSRSISYLYSAMEAKFIPAIKHLASIYEFGYETIDPDENQYNTISYALYELKDPYGMSKYLYEQINHSILDGKSRDDPQIIAQIKQLKSIADAMLSTPPNYSPAPIWLYAKLLLEGRGCDNDFKNAVYYLKKINNFIPSQILLTSLSYSYSKIEKRSSISSIFPYIKHFKWNELQSLPASTAINSTIRMNALNGDPTFRYKLGCILLDVEEDFEAGYELIRQSADSGSICGMTKYGLLRLEGKIRPKNVSEGLTYLKKAGMAGFDTAFLFYAKYGFNFSHLQRECREILKETQFKVDANANLQYNCESISQMNKSYNFVSGMSLLNIQTTSSMVHSTLSNKQDKNSLAEMQHFFELFFLQNETNEASDKPEQMKINQGQQKYLPEAHYQYALNLISQASLLSHSAKSQIENLYSRALEELLKSFNLGYSIAGVKYLDVLFNRNAKSQATEFILNNLFNSTYSLYKAGSMTLFDTNKTLLDRSTATDFLKLATLLDDADQFPDAFWKFGTMLRDGTMVAKDEAGALEHFFKAASYGSSAAAISLGHAALSENAKAQRVLQSSDTPSIHLQNLINTNSKIAYEYFHNASFAGLKEGIWCEAMCKLHGIGCVENQIAAIELLHQLSAQGDPDAYYYLGKMAINISKSSKQSTNFSNSLFQLGLQFFIMAAQRNHSIALFRLGLFIFRQQVRSDMICMSLSIDPSLPNDIIATRLFKQSADLGNRNAAALFSLCLENGIGAVQHFEMAKAYASTAGTLSTE